MARTKGRTNAEGLYLSAPKREEYLNYLYRANTKTKKEIEKLPADKRQQLKDRHPSEINWYYKRKENKLDQFKSLKEYERELARLKKFTSGRYLKGLKMGLQQNYITSLKRHYGNQMGSKAFNQLRTLMHKIPANRFADVAGEEKLPDIDNYYTNEIGLAVQTVDKIRKYLGIPIDQLPEELKLFLLDNKKTRR